MHPVYHNQVFIGGENAIFSAELKQSTDYAASFTNINMVGYFSGDNSVHDLEFAGNRWIGTGEGVISYSDNNGNSWTQAINTWSYPSPWKMYILDIEKSNNGIFYASGAQNNSIRIGLFYSANNGTSWDTISFPTYNNGNPSTKCLAISSDVNHDNVFMGGNGVCLYKRIFTSVYENNNRSMKINVSPNPARDLVTVSYAGEQETTIEIYNTFGKCIIQKALPCSTNNINISYLSKGVYLVKITASDQAALCKIIKE